MVVNESGDAYSRTVQGQVLDLASSAAEQSCSRNNVRTGSREYMLGFLLDRLIVYEMSDSRCFESDSSFPGSSGRDLLIKEDSQVK